MSLEELRNKLETSGIPENSFSINDGLKPNAYILLKNYSKWEFFFLDERGGRNNYVEFNNDREAFDFFWKKLQAEIKYPPSIPPKSVGI